MKKTTLRVISICLSMVILLPLVSCKKKEKTIPLIESIKYKSGQEILETDPYFNAEVNLLKIPVEEGREVEYMYSNPYGFFGDIAVMEYCIDYKVPGGVDIFSLPDDEQIKYHKQGNGIFDGQGNYLSDIPQDINLLYDVEADPDGHLCVLGYGDGEKEKWKKELISAIFDKDGKELKRVTLTGAPFDPGCLFLPKLGFLSDGRCTVRESGALYVFDKEGKLDYTISDPERTMGTGIISKNGKNYVISFGYDREKDEESILLKEINIKTGELGKSYDASGLSAFGELCPTAQGLFVNSSTGCYEYDIETGKLTKFFDWSDTDVNRALLASIQRSPTPKNTNEIYAIGLLNTQEPVEFYLIHLTRTEKNPHAGKKIIVVGGIDINNNKSLMTFISEYNSNHENKCRAVLIDYSEDLESGGNRADVENKVLLDILSGEGPDILVNFSESSSFQSTNVMEDLNPYLDGADGISREDYFDNVFRAQEKNGQLFHMPIRFSLEGLLVNTDYISNTTGWTFDEFEEAASKMPDDVGFMEGFLYKDFLKMLLSSTMSSFVDYQNKTVNFQNDSMKKYLQLARKFGVEHISSNEGVYKFFDGDKLTSDTNFSELKFNNGLIAVRKETLEYYDEIGVYKDYNACTFLGYPSLEGSGAAIKSFLSIGIVSSSKYKDLAWDFLRAFLEFPGDREFYDTPFPVNRKTFETESQRQLQRHVPYFTEEEYNEEKEMIENAKTTFCYDAAMIDVITEEAAAYFAGDRTEDEVLKNIQNRCDLIIKERG